MRVILAIVILAIIIWVAADFNGRLTELNRLTTERDTVKKRLEEQIQTQAVLQTQIAYATSVPGAEEWAYENHMARKGDVAVVPEQAGNYTPAPTPQPTIMPVKESKLQSWWKLFFGR